MTDVALQPGSPEIPDKLYFKIGEVSELLGVEPYVLRYWEGEFPVLRRRNPARGTACTGARTWSCCCASSILLYEKRFTIEGARQALQARRRHPR